MNYNGSGYSFRVINYFNEERVDVYKTEQIGQCMQLAADFICRWGMIAGVPDGEDSSGRVKYRLATEKELVDRAIKTIELFYYEARNRNWVLNLPAPRKLHKHELKGGE